MHGLLQRLWIWYVISIWLELPVSTRMVIIALSVPEIQASDYMWWLIFDFLTLFTGEFCPPRSLVNSVPPQWILSPLVYVIIITWYAWYQCSTCLIFQTLLVSYYDLIPSELWWNETLCHIPSSYMVITVHVVKGRQHSEHIECPNCGDGVWDRDEVDSAVQLPKFRSVGSWTACYI